MAADLRTPRNELPPQRKDQNASESSPVVSDFRRHLAVLEDFIEAFHKAVRTKERAALEHEEKMNEQVKTRSLVGLPIGAVVPALRPKRPGKVELSGRVVSLAPIDPREHGDALWEETRAHDELWTYMAHGPFAERSAFENHLNWMAASKDPFFYAIMDRNSRRAVGCASYLRIELIHRVIEVGNILYAPSLQRTVGATEAMYLMMRYAFDDLGYRRYEWKCDSNNMPSRRAASRLGFQFEGIFRQHMIIKGLNRDTAWFSMVDSEWPARKKSLESWLREENFDTRGGQRVSLSALMGQLAGQESGR